MLRWIMRPCLAALVAAGLAGCAGDVRGVLLPVATAAPDASRVTMLVATTRAPDPDDGLLFSGERGRPSFAEITVSVPSETRRKVGEVQWPKALPGNPETDFVTLKVEKLDQKGVIGRFHNAVQKVPKRRVMVFIHGFNNRFEDAVYRFAQIVHDSGFKGVPVLFTWPSRGQLLAYPYDRESAFYSRDFLELNLRAIARDLGTTRMDILAHSMGTLLTLETIRQASIRGDGTFGGKLRDIILAAPDVDLDVFKTQMREIKRPVTVFVSADDRALDFSRRFAGDKTRLGAVSAKDTQIIADLEKLGARIIDLSAESSGDPLNHSKFASSPKVVQLIGQRLKEDGGIATAGPGLGDRVGDIAGGVVGTVGSTVGLVVTAPAAIVSGRR